MQEITGHQSRMARAALRWSVDELAEAAKVGRITIIRLENGESLKYDTVVKIREAMEKAGVHFVDKGPLAGAVQLRLRPA